MLRCLTAALFVTAATTGAAQADHDRAGTRGTVTAYELDGRTVIDVKTCFRSTHYSGYDYVKTCFRSTHYSGYDYVRCGDRLRDWLKIEICRARGPGTHGYFYQVGDGRPMRLSVYCRRY